jgi:hypothetical protein
MALEYDEEKREWGVRPPAGPLHLPPPTSSTTNTLADVGVRAGQYSLNCACGYPLRVVGSLLRLFGVGSHGEVGRWTSSWTTD